MPLAKLAPAPLAKTNPSPFNSGGWEFLNGVLANITGLWMNASSIWRPLSEPEMEFKYQQQVVVYGCVSFLCGALTEATPLVGIQTKKGWEDLDDHPALELLNDPNPEMHRGEFLNHFYAHLLLTGKSYVWKWRNGYGEASELWPLPSSWVKPIRDKDGLIIAYKVGNNKELVDPRNMIRCILPDPSNPREGVSPLSAASRDIQMDDERTDYFVEMLANNKQPGVVLNVGGDASTEQVTDMKNLLVQRFGKGNRGRPMVLYGKESKLEISKAMEQLDWAGTSNLSETRICSAYGVPPMLINLRAGHDASTFANFAESKRACYEGTVARYWTIGGHAFTKGLIRDEETGARPKEELYFNTDDVPALNEDKDKKSARVIEEFKAGLRTRNEAREVIGLEPVDASQDGFLESMGAQISNGAASEAAPADDGTKAGEEI